jgi:hypothetical protein
VSRRTANNPSGRWLGLSDEQADRAAAAHERAVARQQAQAAARAAEARRRYPHLYPQEPRPE